MAISIGPATDFGAFTRGSDATYFDASGILRTAGPNMLRLTHDPVSGEALGALLEGTRTNLVPRSNDFSYHSSQNTGWAGSVEVIRTELENGWWKLDKTVTGGSFIGTALGAVAGGETCVLRMELRAGEATSISVGIYSSENAWGSINQASAKIVSGPGNVALSAGALANVTDLSPVETTVVEVVRTFLPENTGTKRIYIYPVSTLSSSPAGSVLVRRAQAESAPFASSYVLTAGVTAQRLADSLTFARTGTPEGTVVIEARAAAGIDGFQHLWCWDAQVNPITYIVAYRHSQAGLRVAVVVGGVQWPLAALSGLANDTDFRIAFSFSGSQLHASLNGAAAVTITGSTHFPADTLTKLVIGGNRSGPSTWFGSIASVCVLERAYTPAQLQEMSS